MAPKIKYTREEMIETGINIIKESGIENLTARSLAKRLSISTQPIFTCFGSMEEFQAEIYEYVEILFHEKTQAGLKENTPFLGYGKAYIQFAREEPELYRLLFIDNKKQGYLKVMKDAQDLIRPSLQKIYHIDAKSADFYYSNMWLVVHGIASLIVTECCPYTDKQIGEIMMGFSLSMCQSIKTIPGFVDNNYDGYTLYKKMMGE